MICVRCQKTTSVHNTSWFNLDKICPKCAEEEKSHPLYSHAKEVENKEVMNGNYNYEGIFAGKTWDEIKEIKELA